MFKVIEDEVTRYRIYLPCLPFSAFDRTGQVPLHATAKLLELIRAEAFRKSRFMHNKVTRERRLSVSLVVGEYALSRSWYDKSRGANMDVPVLLSMYLVHIGRRSTHLYCTIQDAGTNHLYAAGQFKMVYIDRTTRKSCPIPDFAIDYKDNLQCEAYLNSTLRKRLSQIPMVAKVHDKGIYQDAFRYNVKVAPSCIDRNQHTNNSEYLKFCMDCAAIAVNQRVVTDFSGDIALYNVCKADVLYQRETVLGDEISVYTWPSRGAQLELCFVITKEGEAVFSSTISFYPLAIPNAKY